MTLPECPLSSTDSSTVSRRQKLGHCKTLRTPDWKKDPSCALSVPRIPKRHGRHLVFSPALSFSGSLSAASGQDHHGPRSNWHPALWTGYACQSGRLKISRNQACNPNLLCRTLGGRCLYSHGCAMPAGNFVFALIALVYPRAQLGRAYCTSPWQARSLALYPLRKGFLGIWWRRKPISSGWEYKGYGLGCMHPS